jgi:N-acetyl sugar amidotransferase
MAVESSKIEHSIDEQLRGQPREVKFCTRCVVSNQRPRIVFDSEGVCSACRYAEAKRKSIDWATRAKELEILCDKHRSKDGSFDVIVPCSGGKDSSMVAHRLKTQYNMHPLTVTWAPFIYTDVGFENFQSFIKSGFTCLQCWPNGHLHRKLARIAFEAVGDAWQPFAYGQMAYAFHIAQQMNIKLIFFGENGEAEYGGVTHNNEKPGMPIEDWSLVYFKGITVDDMISWGKKRQLISDADYSDGDLMFYRAPKVELLKGRDIQMHWFGYYQRWLPQENYYYAAEHTGLKANREGRSEGTYSKYASLDDRLDGFHYYLAFIKFGIGRATSDAAHEVRDGHITREEAVALVQRFDGEFPQRYFREFLEYLSIGEEEFHRIVDRYRPEHLWQKQGDQWALKYRVA